MMAMENPRDRAGRSPRGFRRRPLKIFNLGGLTAETVEEKIEKIGRKVEIIERGSERFLCRSHFLSSSVFSSAVSAVNPLQRSREDLVHDPPGDVGQAEVSA